MSSAALQLARMAVRLWLLEVCMPQRSPFTSLALFPVESIVRQRWLGWGEYWVARVYRFSVTVVGCVCSFCSACLFAAAWSGFCLRNAVSCELDLQRYT